MNGFMGTRIDALCPLCGAVMRSTLDDVRLGRTVRCPNGHEVKLVDEGGGVRNLNREVENFGRQLGRLNKKITIKF